MQKIYEDSDFPSTLYTQFLLLLSSYVSIVHLSQLMNQYRNTIFNCSPYLIQISLVFLPNVLFIVVPESHLRDHITFGCQVPLGYSLLCQLLDFSCFCWLRHFWGVLIQNFVKCSFWDLSDVLLIKKLMLCVWGRKTIGAKCHYPHIISIIYTINITCLC